MDAVAAVKTAAKRAKISYGAIGRKLGHANNYLANMRTRGSVPNADTLANMLWVCGYKLVAVPQYNVPKDAIVIDAPANNSE